MSYYLGIDGGGTKTTAAIGDDAHTVATVTTGPSNIVRVGEAEARTSLQSAVRQACAAAGIAREQVAHTCIGGSGAGRPEFAERVRQILREVLPNAITVAGDMEIALEAAFHEGPGVIVIAGTGSIAYGRDEHGKNARAGGWGFAIGDEGSAHWIGREAVAAVLRASDRDAGQKASPLAAPLCRAWGVSSLTDLARTANSMPPPDFAAMFPVVAAEATNDDLAAQLLTRAGHELAQIAAAVLKRLFDGNRRMTISIAMTGGVFRHAPAVRVVFGDALRKLDALVEVRSDIVEPVEGALRMARKTERKIPQRQP